MRKSVDTPTQNREFLVPATQFKSVSSDMMQRANQRVALLRKRQLDLAIDGQTEKSAQVACLVHRQGNGEWDWYSAAIDTTPPAAELP